MHWLVEGLQARPAWLHGCPLAQQVWLRPPQEAQRPPVQVSPAEQEPSEQQILPLPPHTRQMLFALQAYPAWLHCLPLQQVCPGPPQRPIFGSIGLEGCAGPAAAMKMPASGEASPT
jgi:hypothetical protein